MKIPIFEHKVIKPIAKLGFKHSFWDLHIDTVMHTWVSMAILFAVVIAARFYFKRKKTNPFSHALEQMTEFLVNLCKDSCGFFRYDWFSFISSLFLFTLVCNAAGMPQFVNEPTEDLNTALACGVCSFLYVQIQKIKIEGLWGYISEYFKPIFILFPLNIVGEFAKIASMSFRLFGNILGGAIIVIIALRSLEPYRVHFMIYVAIALPAIWLISKTIDPKKYRFLHRFITFNNLIIFMGAWMMMFFNIFEGVVQAFVITMLTVTYLSLVGKDDPEEEPKAEGVAT
jgi:F-type H+-transporting ATPase subunit a